MFGYVNSYQISALLINMLLFVFCFFLFFSKDECGVSMVITYKQEKHENPTKFVYVIFRKLFVRVIDINLRGGGAPE